MTRETSRVASAMSSIETPPSLSTATRRTRRLPALDRSTASRSSPSCNIGSRSCSARRSLVSDVLTTEILPAVLLWCPHPSATNTTPSTLGFPRARVPSHYRCRLTPDGDRRRPTGTHRERVPDHPGHRRDRDPRLRRPRPTASPADLAPDVAVATEALALVRGLREALTATTTRIPDLAASLSAVAAMHAAHETSLVDAVPDEAREHDRRHAVRRPARPDRRTDPAGRRRAAAAHLAGRAGPARRER